MRLLFRNQLFSNLMAIAFFAAVAIQVEGLFAQSVSDEAAVRALPQAFVAAWARHDGHQLAKIMAADVDFVNVGGDWLHGRSDFETYHTRLLSGRFKESILAAREVQLRFVKPDLALLHWSWSVQGDKNEDLTPRKPRFGLFTMVVQKQGAEWLVIAAQNTNWIPGPNPEMNGIKPPIGFPDAAEVP